MLEGPMIGILLAAAWLVCVDYVVFARYAYEVTDDAVHIRRWIFRVIPFGSCTIPLRNVREIARLGPPWLPAGFPRLWGRIYSTQGVVLVLKRPYCGLFRRVHLTPDNPGAFMGMVLSGLRALKQG